MKRNKTRAKDMVSILFAGDFCPINRVEDIILQGRAPEVFGDMLGALHDKDLSVVNLECPLTKRTAPIAKRGPNLKAHPGTIEAVKAAKFDIANLANNHLADHGSKPVVETMNLLKANRIKFVGGGANINEAQKPLKVTCKGKRIVFLSFAENEFTCADDRTAGAWPLDPVTNIKQIRKARKNADILIVMVHGGNETNPVPSPRIINTYRALVDAGADALIGTHPHVPQGYEIYNGAPIFYSIGNFVFDVNWKKDLVPFWYKSYAVRLTFMKNLVSEIDIIPYKTDKSTACLTLLAGKELDDFLAYLEYISAIIKDFSEVQQYWNSWCAWKGPEWIEPFTKPVYPWKTEKQKNDFLGMRNRMSCEAHHELIVTFMDLIRKKRLGKAKKYIQRIKMLMNEKIPGKK